MSKYRYNEITLWQYVSLISGAQVGIGVLTLPREVAELAGPSGWISIVFGWFFSMVLSVLIIKLMDRHPGMTIFDLASTYLGVWLGKGFIAIWVLYASVAVLAVLYNYVYIVQVWILNRTPNWALMTYLLLPSYYICRNGWRILGRYAELVTLLTIWMAFIFIFPLRDAHWMNLLPLVRGGWGPLLLATKTTFLSYLGFELAFFLHPFLKYRNQAVKGVFFANTISLLIYLSITIICFVFYSEDGVQNYMWPTLNLLKSFQLKFLERIEIIFLSFYFFVITTTFFPYLYLASYGISQLFGKADHRWPLRVLLVLLALSAFFFNPSFEDIMQLGNVWSYSGMGLALLSPILWWLYVLLYRMIKGKYKGKAVE